jgi:hypothetical protein
MTSIIEEALVPGPRTTVAPENLYLPGEGIIAESYSRLAPTTANAWQTGDISVTRIGLRQGALVTNCLTAIITAAAGTAPTLLKMALLDRNFVVLGQSANLASDPLWTSQGTKQVALTAPLTVPSDNLYYVASLLVGSFGTTQPQFARIASANANIWNALPGGFSVALGTGSGKTDFPANGTAVTGLTFAGGLGWWAGVN